MTTHDNYVYLTVYPKDDDDGNINYADRRLLRAPKRFAQKIHNMIEKYKEENDGKDAIFH